MKHFCASCSWFKADENIKRESAIRGGSAMRGGFCCFNPPTVHVVTMQHPVTHQIGAQMTPARPAVFADEFCRSHSAYDFDRLVYDPMSHPDTGFNRPPTLAEAMQFTPKDDKGAPIKKGGTLDLTPGEAPGG